VLDAGVLTLHFAGDPRIIEYVTRIEEEKATGLLAEVNLAEYYYKTCQKLGRQAADIRYFMMRASKLRLVYDENLTRAAGLEKCRQQQDLSLADCYALALAKREKALLLTTDEPLRRARGVQAKLFKV